MICHGMNLTRFAKMFSILNILLYQINKDATIDEGKICKNLNQIYIPRNFY